MEQTGVEEVTNMEKDASKLWFTSLTSAILAGIDFVVSFFEDLVYIIQLTGITAGRCGRISL